MYFIKVSVVIPFYNERKYITDCLVTLINQTLSQIEIICVSDGSTDGSIDLVKQAMEHDSRIKLYELPHSSAGAARNFGMSKSIGQYIIFLDADDLFNCDMLERAYNKAESEKADVCLFDASTLIYEKKIYKMDSHYLNQENLVTQGPVNYKTYPDIFNLSCAAPWNKLYNRNFVMNTGLQFMDVFKHNDVFFYSVFTGKSRQNLCY